MAECTGWGCRGRNFAGLEAVKTKTSKGKREGEIRPQRGKDQCWQWGNENILGCRRNTCIFGSCQQKRLHFSCKNFYRALYEMVEKQSTQQHFEFLLQRTKQHPSVKLPISKPFCMRHQPEFSHISCAKYSQLRCWTEPAGMALFYLGSMTFIALPASHCKVSQSTVMSCLTDSSHIRAERELDYSLFSCFKPLQLQLQWKGLSNIEQAEPRTGMSSGFCSHPDRKHELSMLGTSHLQCSKDIGPLERGPLRPLGKETIARIYINPDQSGITQGTGMWKESAENIHRKMHIPPAYGGACSSRHDWFQFSWRMGVGGTKQGEKGVSFQKSAKHLILVFSLQGMDHFQRLDHTEALVSSCKSLHTWITLPHLSSQTGRTKIFTVLPFSFIKWLIANMKQGHTELNLVSDTQVLQETQLIRNLKKS